MIGRKPPDSLNLNMDLTKTQIQDILQWDVVNWCRMLPFWSSKLPESKTVGLAIGDRHAGLAIWLGLQGFDKIYCSDIEQPTEKADALVAEYGFQNKIECHPQDMLKMSYPDNYADVVCFKSVLGAIRSSKALQQAALDECYRVLKPGGVLLFAENTKSSWLHRFARKYFVSWGQSWLYFNYRTDRKMFHKFSHMEYATTGFLGAFGRNEKQRNALGKIDGLLCFRKHSALHYIIYGCAVK